MSPLHFIWLLTLLVAAFLFRVAVNGQPRGVEEILLTLKTAWENDYREFLQDPSIELLSQCGPILSEDGVRCVVSGSSVQSTLTGLSDFIQSPPLLARLCTAYSLNMAWRELVRTSGNLSLTELTFTDSSGYFTTKHAANSTSPLLVAEYTRQCSGPIPDPRSSNQAYVRTLSSPKHTTIVNLVTGNSSRSVINTILTETLTHDDYITLFHEGAAPVINNSSYFPIRSTAENIAGLLETLDCPRNGNGTLGWLDFNSLNASIENISSLNNDFNVSVCYQNLFLLLDRDVPEGLATLIESVSLTNPSLLILIYIFGDDERPLTSRGFPIANSLLCSSRAIIEHVAVMDEQAEQRTVLDSLNYIKPTVPPTNQSSTIVWTALPSSTPNGRACVPLFDTISYSQTGLLVATLCLDVFIETTPTNEFSCPSATNSLYEFSFARSAFMANPTLLDCPSHLPGTPTSTLFNVYRDLLHSLVVQEQFSIFLVNETSLVRNGCPTITGRPALWCSGTQTTTAGGLNDSSLLWSPRLEQLLPLETTDFNRLNSSGTLWQSLCSSSYSLRAWKAIYNSRSPVSLTYADYSHGYIRTFPGYQATEEECLNLDQFDTRLLPWFNSAASGPKVVIIIVDVAYNFLDSVSDIKSSLTVLVNSLNQFDYFALIYTNQDMSSSAQVSMATQDNISATTISIEFVDFSSGTRNVESAVSKGVTMVTDTISSPVASDHNIVVVVLTDNSFTDEHTTNFTSPLSDSLNLFLTSNVRVFTYLFSGFQEGTILKALSCSTGGVYDRLYNLTTTDLSLRILSVYSFFIATGQPLGQQIWSEITNDIVTGLDSTRVCQPVYRTGSRSVGLAGMSVVGGLRGVLCISLPVGNLTSDQQQALQLVIYNSKPAVVTPNLTLELENSLRGIHQCDTLLTTSAESFRFRVEQVVRLFRLVMETAFTNSLNSESCPYGDSFIDSCSSQNQTSLPLTPSNQFACSINEQFSELYSRGFLAGVIPLLNFSIDAFQTLTPETFRILCSSQRLNDVWLAQENQILDEPGVLWRYYGDALSGIMRYYPYSDCGLNDPTVCSSRNFDPRLRPWYVSAVSAPKTVYLLIHSTNEENYQLIIQTAVTALDTITHRDYVLAQFAGEERPFDDFSLNNKTVRQQVHDILEAHSFTASTGTGVDLSNVFQSALLAFQETKSSCHDVILFFTDASLPSSLPASIQQTRARAQLDVDIFVYSFGGITVDTRVAMVIACENGGEGFVVDKNDIEVRVHSYLNFYAALVQNEGVVWTDFYQDVFSEKTVLSSCLPVYDPQSVETAPVLLGVTCLDIDPSRFDDFSDGQLVLDSLVNAAAIVCPTSRLTEAQRETIRQTKCRVGAADMPEGLVSLFAAIVEQGATDYSRAYKEISENGSSECPFRAILYNSCNLTKEDTVQFSSDDRLLGGVNISFSGLGVILSSEYKNVTFQPLTTDKTIYKSLCPALVLSRTWEQTYAVHNITTFQFFTSENGFSLVSPAVQSRKDVCDNPTFDPRLRSYYSATTSGYKDVAIVIDLETNSTVFPLSIYERAALYLLPTLSILDHLGIVAGQDMLDSSLIRGDSAGLNRAAQFLSTLVKYQPKPQHELVEQAFQMLSSSRENQNSSNCQVALVILTNREITMETCNMVAMANSAYSQLFSRAVGVFVNSFINTPQGSEEVELVCSNNGVWNLITPDQFNNYPLLQQKVTSYQRVLAKALIMTTPIWSEVYDDALGEGDVSTVCQAVYDTSVNIGRLVGVSCADVPVRLFERLNVTIGKQFLQDMIESQRSRGECFTMSVSAQELDELRDGGARCLVPVTSGPPSSSQSPSTSISTTTDVTDRPSITSKTGLSPGATAAVVISVGAVCVCITAGLCVVVFYWLKRRRQLTARLTIMADDQLQEKLLEDPADEL